MLFERHYVAVVQVQPERPGFEFIGKLATWLDDWRNPVHGWRVNAVKVDGMFVRGTVGKVKTQQVAFRATVGWTGNLTVIRPGRKINAWGDFDFLLECGDLVFTQDAAVSRLTGSAGVELGHEGGRVKTE